MKMPKAKKLIRVCSPHAEEIARFAISTVTIKSPAPVA